MSAVTFIDEANPADVEGLKVGAVITYRDMMNNSRGLVYEIGERMVKVAWTDRPGLTQVPANAIEGIGGWALTGEVEPAEAALAAYGIAMQAREQQREQAEEARRTREQLTDKGRALLARIMPETTKAVIIAVYEEDKSDTMTDLFQVNQGRTVVLGFSSHTRDLFSEMRKVAKLSGFPEVAHLVEGGKDQEHREKYSMGRGYYLKGSGSYSDGWTLRKRHISGGAYGVDSIALAIMEEGGNHLPDAGKKVSTSNHIADVRKKVADPVGGTACTLRENPSKNGIELTFPGKPSAAIRDTMKGAGFRWHRRGGYWYAKDSASTRAVAEELAGGDPPTPEQRAETVKAVQSGNADKLRTLADKMEKQIDAKINPAISQQNPTRRRAGIAAGMQAEGEALQKVQAVLYGLASAIDAGTLPDILAGLKSKAVISDVLRLESYYQSYPDHGRHMGDEATKKRLKSAGITRDNFPDVAELLFTQYIKPPSPEQVQAKAIAEMERELIGMKIDGFFPTPSSVIDQMMHRAGIEPGMTVLEPSAGKGDIADRIRERHPESHLEVIEVNYRLREILKAKGYPVIKTDFLELEAGQKFYRILMNPPFEKYADVEHVRKAYDHLVEGGRLVAIMCEGPFFRDDSKGAAFRQWLEDVNGYGEKLEDGSFTGAEAFRQTGVAARLVVIDK